jgi:hypothetical protein
MFRIKFPVLCTPCGVEEGCVSEELITSVFSVEEEARQGARKSR